MEAELFARARHGMRLGLDRMERALEALGRPDRCAPAFHVAGTNGKGSVCAMIDAGLRASGLHTGLYTSPHLERFSERFQVDGVPMEEGALVELYDDLHQRIPWAFEGPEALTFFELVTLLAFQHFARAGVQVMVIEVGLGGRLDATNVLSPLVTCITPVGFDHREFLGDTLAAIAGEKAGILKRGCPAVVARQPAEASDTILKRALDLDVPVSLEDRDFAIAPSAQGFAFSSPEGRLANVTVGLRGGHQQSNAAVAIRALELARLRGLPVPEAAVRDGVAGVRWPGRLETIARDPEIVLDGAHNPPAAAALASAWAELYPGRRTHLVVGVLADKDAAHILSALAPLAARIIATQPASSRALPAEILARQVRGLKPVEVVPIAEEAIRWARSSCASEDVILICGSLYLAGEVRAILGGRGHARGPGEILKRT